MGDMKDNYAIMNIMDNIKYAFRCVLVRVIHQMRIIQADIMGSEITGFASYF